eukprot:1929809-Rhodomonas_salina.1
MLLALSKRQPSRFFSIPFAGLLFPSRRCLGVLKACVRSDTAQHRPPSSVPSAAWMDCTSLLTSSIRSRSSHTMGTKAVLESRLVRICHTPRRQWHAGCRLSHLLLPQLCVLCLPVAVSDEARQDRSDGVHVDGVQLPHLLLPFLRPIQLPQPSAPPVDQLRAVLVVLCPPGEGLVQRPAPPTVLLVRVRADAQQERHCQQLRRGGCQVQRGAEVVVVTVDVLVAVVQQPARRWQTDIPRPARKRAVELDSSPQAVDIPVGRSQAHLIGSNVSRKSSPSRSGRCSTVPVILRLRERTLRAN